MTKRLGLLLFWIIILFFEFIVHTYLAFCIIFNTNRATEIILAYDRVGNVAMGQGNETVSSWAGRHNSWLEKYINFLFELMGQKNHCDSVREK